MLNTLFADEPLFLPWMAAEKRVPVVVSLHGSCGQVDWFGKGEPRSLDGDFVRLAEAVALRGADVVHANSRANAEFWREKTGREIRVIPPAYGGGTKADLTTEDTEVTETAVGPCLDKPSGALFSNPFTSELARDSENISPTRSAIGPAGAAEPLRVDAGGLVSDGTEFPKPLDSGPSSLDSSSPATSNPLPATAPQARKGLVVGRLQNWKGAEVLCQAMRLAPEIEIEWVGGDTDWGTTRMKASEYLATSYPDVFGKRFRWIGRLERDQVSQKMKVAGFLVVPSIWDVFNLTVAEGMEAGLPVICSRSAGAEMLIQHGINGLLFDPAKPEELADSLKFVDEMSEAKRVQMGFSAQEAVKTHLNEEKILNVLELSYGNAIKIFTITSKDAWLEALISAEAEQGALPNPNLVQRAIRKAGRMLANV